MEKTSIEMDLGEWEFLPDSKSFVGFGHEGGKDLFPKEIRFDTKGIVDMNYFICPSPTSAFIHAEEEEKSNPATETKKALPEPVAKKKPDDHEAAKEFKDIGVVPPVIAPNHDPAVSQVSFKVKENEFVDMKMNSPKSNTRGIIPHIEPDPILFVEHEKEVCKVEEMEEDDLESEVKGKPCWENFGFNIWRWRLAGIGALCSIGVAAFCILILGGRQRQQQQNQRIQFQIYADDKRIKQMVRHTARLNQALSAARGGPMTRAQNVARISFGGYYDGL
ncbi:hypothetical protein COCNU_06G014260 [Cocos nucifera]|uniref:DUF6821 domain-containing protein n=1 Tax=Cocos nucifera TaxID=13894 RepID=A0A8K0ID16_COCNU|nr:hypothetical protein COCNU_06G014260 [Cocos nucifera]